MWILSNEDDDICKNLALFIQQSMDKRRVPLFDRDIVLRMCVGRPLFPRPFTIFSFISDIFFIIIIFITNHCISILKSKSLYIYIDNVSPYGLLIK